MIDRTRHAAFRQFLPLVVLVVLAAAISPDAIAGGATTIVSEGQAKAYIVLDDQVDPLNKIVADDFAAIIHRMTGASISSERAAGSIPIHIGEANQYAHVNSLPQNLEQEEFFLRVTPDAVYICGGSPLGTSHGVYAVLRDIGCRWVMPGAIGECLPDTRTIALSQAGERREKPDFTYRDIWYAYGCSPDAGVRHAEWLRRNRMYRPPVQHGHNLTSTLARLAPFEKRPELYGLLNGERKKQQICTSNPETVALCVQSIKQYLRENPSTQSYSLCPDDNHDFCECASCKALDSGKMDSGGLPSVADRYQTFLNAVLAGLKDEFPKVKVTTYSYNRNHTDPPVNTPVDPRTCIFATSSVYCSAHGIGDAQCDSRQAMRALLEKWTSVTPNVYIYEYDPVPYSGGLPWPMWKAHVKESAVYKKIGVTGISFEGQDSWAPYFPNYYIAAQCMWNSAQDGDALFTDMLRAFFENAANDMAAYYGAFDSVFDAVTRKVEWGLTDYPKLFTPDLVERCRKSLAAAEQLQVAPIVRQRLEMVRLSFDEMDAYLAIRRADSSMTFAAYRANVDKLYGSIDRMAGINEDFLLAPIAREKTGSGISDKFARELGFINQWLLCGPFDNTGMDGLDRVYGPEQSIDPGAAFEGKNGKKAAWKANRTPEWQGFVDLLNEFDDTDWVCAYALCYVTVADGPKDVMLRVGSNDSIKVFLNGAAIHSNNTQRTASVDNDAVPVTLPKGTSTLLLKVGQAGLKWGFFCRITERDSLTIPAGLSVSITHP